MEMTLIKRFVIVARQSLTEMGAEAEGKKQ
jgi:hypothetical protein